MAIALIVCIVGAVLYALLTEIGKLGWLAELGRLAFFAGLLAYLLK